MQIGYKFIFKLAVLSGTEAPLLLFYSRLSPNHPSLVPLLYQFLCPSDPKLSYRDLWERSKLRISFCDIENNIISDIVNV